MNKEKLLKQAKDPKYISGIYNYCDRWCERCQFTSRCLNCTLVKEQFGDLQAVDEFNEKFWKKYSEILQDTLALVKEMASEEGIDIEEVCKNEDAIEEIILQPDIISHLSKKYAESVDDWFDSNTNSFYEKEVELNRIRLLSSKHNPAKEATEITDAIGIIRWYQYQVHVKLVRARESAVEEARYEDGFPKDSDGSAKVALIGIDRSIAAWKILSTHLPTDKAKLIHLIELLEKLKDRAENRFPCARNFIKPGFDEDRDNHTKEVPR